MRRKFISALLFGALVTASTSTFVSCKDYDDDINGLQGQITTNASTLEEMVNEKVSNLTTEINTLKDQDAALTQALDQAKADLNAAIEEAKTAASDAEAAAKAYADVQAEAARVAAIEAAKQSIADAQAQLQAGIDAATQKLEEISGQVSTHETQIAGLLDADKELQDAITAANGKIDAAQTTANDALASAQEANDKLAQVVENLTTVKGELDSQISLLGDKVDQAVADIAANKAEVDADIAEANSLIQSNADAIAALQGKDTELGKLIEANTNELTALKGQLESLQSALDANLKSAKAYTDAQIEGLKSALGIPVEDIKTNFEDIQGRLGKAEEQLAEIVEALKSDDGSIGSISSSIASLREDLTELTEQVATNLETTNQKIGELEGDIEEINGKLATNTTNISDLQERVSTLESQIGQWAEGIGTVAENVKLMQDNITAHSDELARLAGLSKQLKSLVFCPTTYVDGIECIKFATLKYQDWGLNPSNWEADAAKSGNKYYVIDDAEQYEEYFANPRNVLKSDIKSLEFVSNEATNTRAVSNAAPIAIANWELGNNDNGAYVMKLNLKKTTDASFGTDKDKFTIVALKATLDDKYLTEEEKKNGEKAEVYSDWARLYETSETPRIHNALMVDANGKPISGKSGSHFWTYSEVYANKTKNDALPTRYNALHIAQNVYYEDEVDLDELMMVCDGTNTESGTIYDEEKYGLDYEYHIMDYTLENEGSTTDATNQKHFAKLKDGHILVSTARDGQTEKNRDAIGRQPMIQVVLKDVRDPKNVKVVDVRYFKIKWVDKTIADNYGELEDFTAAYECGAAVKDLVVKEEVMNGIYTKYNMSRDEFHNSYKLGSSLYATADDAMNVQNPKASLGTIVDLSDAGGHGQTHNLQWNINTTQNAATQAEYEQGYKDITAYGYYQSTSNENSRIVFEVSLRLNIAQMAYADGVNKDQTMWKDGARNVNPQLESDANFGNSKYSTTMIFGSFLKGYINNGQTPSSIDQLVNFNDDVNFVFDEDKLSEVAQATGTNEYDWAVKNNGKELHYKGQQAAFISGNDRIQLWESNITLGNVNSVPSEGAKLLVGKSVPVKLVDEWCDLTDIIDAYNVNFLTPLKFTESYKSVTLKDITAGGSSSSALAGTIEITEAFTTNKRVVYDNKKTGSKTNAALVKWYAVETPAYGVAQAKTNIQTNGQIGESCNTLLTDIKNADGSAKYVVEIVGTGANTQVKFYNMSGNAIGQEFKIEIPVTVVTKWQTMHATLAITVQPAI